MQTQLVVLTLLCLGLAGCRSEKNVTHLRNGYEEVAHPVHNFLIGEEPPPPRVALQYRGTGSQTKPILIWPALSGANEVIKDDLAIFVGDKAYVQPERVTHPRLFAVKPPELPLDITDEVLWRWSQLNHKDFSKTLERFSLVTPEEKNGGLQLHLEFLPVGYLTAEDWPDKSDLQLDWK